MSGVFIQMCMFEAEQQNTTLRADVNYMENYKALEDIKDFEKLSLTGGAGFSLQKKKTSTASKLPTLGSAMMMNNHESSEAASLKEENSKVKQMMSVMQEKLAQALTGKSLLTEKSEGTLKDSNTQIDELKMKLSQMSDERDQAVEISDNLRKEAQNTK